MFFSSVCFLVFIFFIIFFFSPSLQLGVDLRSCQALQQTVSGARITTSDSIWNKSQPAMSSHLWGLVWRVLVLCPSRFLPCLLSSASVLVEIRLLGTVCGHASLLGISEGLSGVAQGFSKSNAPDHLVHATQEDVLQTPEDILHYF